MNLSQLSKLQKLKSGLDTFQRNHPKFGPFLEAANRDALEEGSIIEITVSAPGGKRYETNLKLKQDDLDFLRLLKEINGH